MHAIRIDSEHDEFEELMYFLSVVAGKVESALKKKGSRITTLTALRVLRQIGARSDYPPRALQSVIAQDLGLSRYAINSVIKQLIAKELVVMTEKPGMRNKPLALTRSGLREASKAQLVVDDVLGQIKELMPDKHQPGFVAAIAGTNRNIGIVSAEERHEMLMKTYSKHSTRQRAHRITPKKT